MAANFPNIVERLSLFERLNILQIKTYITKKKYKYMLWNMPYIKAIPNVFSINSTFLYYSEVSIFNYFWSRALKRFYILYVCYDSRTVDHRVVMP